MYLIRHYNFCSTRIQRITRMLTTTASYILISTLISNGVIVQSTATFADKPSCESAATRQDFVYKDMQIKGKWNLTCHPYQLAGEKK